LSSGKFSCYANRHSQSSPDQSLDEIIEFFTWWIKRTKSKIFSNPCKIQSTYKGYPQNIQRITAKYHNYTINLVPPMKLLKPDWELGIPYLNLDGEFNLN
jgi:hypothetical protein